MLVRQTTWVGTLVFVLLLSGCAGEESGLALEAPTEGVTDGPMAESTEPGARPVWTHGDWWQYALVFDAGIGEPLIQGDDKLIVNGASASGYDIASGGRSVGVIDAEFNMFFMGAVDPDLNGDFGFEGRKLRMFDWPLEDQKTWTADLVEFDLNGEIVNVPTPMTATAVATTGSPRDDGPGFRISGTTPNGWTMSYTYSPAVKYVTDLSIAGPDGFVLLSMQLRDFGSNYTGSFVVLELTSLHERFILVPFFVFDPSLSPVPPVDQVMVSDEHTFLLEVIAFFRFSAGIPPLPAAPAASASTVVVETPDNMVRPYSHTGSGDDFEVNILFHEPFEAGTWNYAYEVAGTGVGVFVFLHGFAETVVQFTPESHEGHSSGG